MLLKVRIDRSQPQHFISTEIDRNAPCRQVFSGTQWSTSRDTCQVGQNLERDFQISKHYFISQRENLDKSKIRLWYSDLHVKIKNEVELQDSKLKHPN